MSDIGINSPGDLAVVVLILAWPLLIAGGLIGAAGWVAGRGRRPWTGAVAGMLAGVAAAAAGFVVYMSWNG
jgi:hypothetical protein